MDDSCWQCLHVFAPLCKRHMSPTGDLALTNNMHLALNLDSSDFGEKDICVRTYSNISFSVNYCVSIK